VEYQQQLPLPDVASLSRKRRDDDWRLDEPTRLAGRRGLAAARTALARCAPPEQPRADAA
jgi:hypothetical protein